MNRIVGILISILLACIGVTMAAETPVEATIEPKNTFSEPLATQMVLLKGIFDPKVEPMDPANDAIEITGVLKLNHNEVRGVVNINNKKGEFAGKCTPFKSSNFEGVVLKCGSEGSIKVLQINIGDGKLELFGKYGDGIVFLEGKIPEMSYKSLASSASAPTSVRPEAWMVDILL